MDDSNPLVWLEDDYPSQWEEEPIENYKDVHQLYRIVDKSFWGPWPDLMKIYPNFFSFDKKKELPDNVHCSKAPIAQ